VTNACQGLRFLSAVCRLYTTFALAVHHTQEGDDTWQAAFKLSYELGCSVLRGTQALPPVHIDHVTSGSHLMRLTMQHQELVAAPTPVAGQGNCPYIFPQQSKSFPVLLVTNHLCSVPSYALLGASCVPPEDPHVAWPQNVSSTACMLDVSMQLTSRTSHDPIAHSPLTYHEGLGRNSCKQLHPKAASLLLQQMQISGGAECR